MVIDHWKETKCKHHSWTSSFGSSIPHLSRSETTRKTQQGSLQTHPSIVFQSSDCVYSCLLMLKSCYSFSPRITLVHNVTHSNILHYGYLCNAQFLTLKFYLKNLVTRQCYTELSTRTTYLHVLRVPLIKHARVQVVNG